MTTTTNRTSTSDGRTGSGGRPDLRSTLGTVASRPPRRAGQWVAAVLFVGVVALGLVMLFRAQSETTEVLVVAKPVTAGSTIDASVVLTTANVSGVSGAVPAERAHSIDGMTAAVGLVEGQVLTDAMVTDQPTPGEGDRVVAVRLDKGRVPGELMPGQVVEVLAAPMEGASGTKQQLNKPEVLAASARVQSLGKTADGAVVVTIVVPEAEASRVAAYSAAGQVTIVQAPLSSLDETAGEQP